MTTTEPLFCTICPPRFRKLRGEEERRVGRCWEHKNSIVGGTPGSGVSGPARGPVTAYAPDGMTPEDFEDEQDTKVAGYVLAGPNPDGTNELTLAATVSVWARDAAQIDIANAVGTAYQASCVHRGGPTVNRTFFVEEDARPTHGHRYYVTVEKHVYPAGVEGAHALAGAAPTREYPEAYGHDVLITALAEARECALDAGWVGAP